MDRPLRIGVMGNINNCPMIIARALRRLGHDVRVCIDSRERLNRPESRYSDIGVPYPEWITDVSLMRSFDFVLPTLRRARALSILRQCDALVLNGLGPALWPLVQRPSVIVATGSDLEFWANPAAPEAIASSAARFPRALRTPRRAAARWVVERQRQGYRAARGVICQARGISSLTDTLLAGLGVTGDRRLFLMPLELEALPGIEDARQRLVPRVFAVARHAWKKPLPPHLGSLDDKGNDVMIRGIARYVRETGARIDLRLVEKGPHVAESRALLVDEGIAHLATWLPELTQAEVWREYVDADIVFDQLGTSTMATASVEAMGLARPVIANGRPEIMDAVVGERSPHCQATTPEEVACHLSRLASDVGYRIAVGTASRDFVRRHHFVDSWIGRVAQLLSAKSMTSSIQRSHDNNSPTPRAHPQET